MKIIDELVKIIPELTDEQKSAITSKFSAEVITIAEHDKKMQKAGAETESLRERLETAESTLKGFEGKDFDAITRERDEWKKKSEEAEAGYKAKLAEREKSDLLKDAFAEIKFTSAAARNAIMSQISADISVKDGKLIGLSDLIASARESDPDAFVPEQAETRSKFTSSITLGSDGSNGTDVAKLRSVMGLENSTK